jgi:hypothetical protein
VRVRCEVAHQPLDVGEEYVVLCFSTSKDGLGTFGLHRPPDDRGPTFWPAEIFSILDPTLPRLWTAHLTPVRLLLAPPGWHAPDFFEGLTSSDYISTERAREIHASYKHDLAILLAES